MKMDLLLVIVYTKLRIPTSNSLSKHNLIIKGGMSFFAQTSAIFRTQCHILDCMLKALYTKDNYKVDMLLVGRINVNCVPKIAPVN